MYCLETVVFRNRGEILILFKNIILNYYYEVKFIHLSGNFMLLIVATALTWSSPVIPKLKDANESPFNPLPSIEDTTWISSITLLGASIGSIIYSFLADYLGRRLTLISLGMPILCSYLVMAFLETIESYYAARLVAGLVIGGAFSVVPVYIAELASKSNRAVLSALMSCAVNGGCLLSYSLGPFVQLNIFNIILSVLPVCFLCLFLMFGQETAHFYMSKGREQEAKEALKKQRDGSNEVDAELKEMKIKLVEQNHDSLLALLKTKPVLKAFFIAIGLLVFQQFSGINIFLFYSQTLFDMSGSIIDSKYCPIIVGSVQFVSSLVSIITAEKFRRKPLLIASAAGMIAGLLPMGTYCYFRAQNSKIETFSFIPVLCLAFVAFSYNNGLGPLPWAILGEIFPARLKALGTAVATFINWTLAFLLTKYFEALTDAIGLGASFFMYAGCSALSIVFVVFVLVETKDKTLEEIQDKLRR